MTWTTLISVDDLASHIDQCLVVDCRHDLMAPQAGPAAYAAGHLPGAAFLDQGDDLSGAKTGQNGRHPLPSPEQVVQRLRAIGLAPGQQLVAYDGGNGVFASRLWWLARWVGHDAVAVLDGGLDAWKKAGFPVTTDLPTRPASQFARGPALVEQRDLAAMVDNLTSRQWQVVDARAPERFAGDTEPIDPVAGHIPGALNRSSGLNVRPDGRFKPPQVLRAEFDALLAGRAPGQVIHSCGSGISACHNLLAMASAGLQGSLLYGGSWSEWCADPARPVATGPA